MLLEDGSRYEGGFDNEGRMDGEGTLRMENGNVYVGGFKAGQRHGAGYLLDYKDEAKIKEDW